MLSCGLALIISMRSSETEIHLISHGGYSPLFTIKQIAYKHQCRYILFDECICPLNEVMTYECVYI